MPYEPLFPDRPIPDVSDEALDRLAALVVSDVRWLRAQDAARVGAALAAADAQREDEAAAHADPVT